MNVGDLFELALGGMLIGGFALLAVLVATTVVFEVRDWRQMRRREAANRRRTIVVVDQNGGRRHA